MSGVEEKKQRIYFQYTENELRDGWKKIICASDFNKVIAEYNAKDNRESNLIVYVFVDEDYQQPQPVMPEPTILEYVP